MLGVAIICVYHSQQVFRISDFFKETIDLNWAKFDRDVTIKWNVIRFRTKKPTIFCWNTSLFYINRMEDSDARAICLDIFTFPKILPCGHTFCFQCFEEISSEQRRIPGPSAGSWKGWCGGGSDSCSQGRIQDFRLQGVHWKLIKETLSICLYNYRF
jgi:hypothetical protein